MAPPLNVAVPAVDLGEEMRVGLVKVMYGLRSWPSTAMEGDALEGRGFWGAGAEVAKPRSRRCRRPAARAHQGTGSVGWWCSLDFI